jgi:hypothetical protein
VIIDGVVLSIVLCFALGVALGTTLYFRKEARQWQVIANRALIQGQDALNGWMRANTLVAQYEEAFAEMQRRQEEGYDPQGTSGSTYVN